MNRRQFASGLIQSVASYALLQTLLTRNAFSKEMMAHTNAWVMRLREMALDLHNGTLTPLMWQNQIKALFDQVSLKELLAAIEFDKLLEIYTYPDLGAEVRRTNFPGLSDLPKTMFFGSKIFGLKKDRAIIPHGHRNMVSCHYVLKGDFHLRHYEKVEEDASHMVIRPTIDEMAGIGSHSSISDEKNNIHWLKAETDVAFTFDVIVSNFNGKAWEVDNIDPYAAERMAGGLIRAKKIDVHDALEKYGHDTHH